MERKEIKQILTEYLNDDRLIVYKNEGYPICVKCKDNEFSKKQIQRCCEVASVFEMQFYICVEEYIVKIIFNE